MAIPVIVVGSQVIFATVRSVVAAHWGKALIGWGAIEGVRNYARSVNTGVAIIDEAAQSLANLQLPDLSEMFPRLVNDISAAVIAEINERLNTDFVDFTQGELMRVVTKKATEKINERMGTSLEGLSRADIESEMKRYFLARINATSGLNLESLDYPSLENAIALKLGIRTDPATRAQILAKERQRRHRERLLTQNLKKKCMWVYEGEADGDGLLDGIDPNEGDEEGGE